MALTDYHPTYLTLNECDEVVVAALNLSHLTDEENIEQLGRELFALVEQYDCRKVVLDMDSVTYATSSVLGKMISLHRKLHRNGGKLVICRVREELLKVLRSSRLIDYFHVADDVDAAVAQFE